MKKQFLIITTLIFTGIFTILFFAATGQNPAAQAGSETAELNKSLNLQGNEAIEHLKKDGSYQSFVEAYTAVRYSFEPSKTNRSDFYAENDAHKFRADFDKTGVKISDYKNDWKFDWQLKSIGRGTNQTLLETGETVKKGNRIEIEKSKIQNPKSKILTEWFQNQPDGLEQGFIVHQKPNSGDEKLRLILTTDSIAKAIDNGQSLELSNKENGKIMRYENLKVWDAENTILTAAMRVEDSGEIFLEVEDERAVYPVTIDPKFVQVQKIYSTSYGSYYGERFAVSGDFMAVGAPTFQNDRGFVYVFRRTSNGNWAENASLSVPLDTSNRFGDALAINGNTLAVSAPNKNTGRGEVSIYKYNGSTFVFSQALTAPSADQVDNHHFGASLAMQGDTLIIGANGGSNNQAVYVFRDPGVSAFVFRKKLVPSVTDDLQFFGSRVRYSGNTIAVSGGTCICLNAPVSPNATGGSVYVFTGSDTNWTQQARITTPGTGFIGFSFDIEGDTLVLSEQTINPQKVYVYQRNGTFWINQQTLVPLSDTPTADYGEDISISGGTIAVSDTNYSGTRGAVYLFTKTGGVWRERQKLQPTDSYVPQRFGREIHIANGNIYATSVDTDLNDRRPIYEFQLNQTVPADFDGDGKSDVSIFRPSTSVWYIQQSQNGFASTQFGVSTDMIAAADFDGDGKTDVSVFRPSNGVWYRINSSTSTYESIQFGTNGDKAVPGDYDGDGISDITVFRPSNGVWYRINSSDGQFVAETFGSNGDIPVAADYDGDGITDKAIFRPSNGQWWLDRSSLGVSALSFGVGTDIPVQGDYTGDGKTDVAIFRPATGEWFVLRSENNSYYSFPFGTNGDIPAPGDYDGDGFTDSVVFRPGNGVWYLMQTQAGFTAFQFGSNGDRPVTALPN